MDGKDVKFMHLSHDIHDSCNTPSGRKLSGNLQVEVGIGVF